MMALHFDYRKVKGPRVNPHNLEEIHPDLDRMIWATLFVDMGEVTEKNHKEFYFRLSMHERVTDAPYRTSIKVVRDYIGLETNVSHKTRLQFLKKLGRIYDDDVAAQFRYYESQLAKATGKEQDAVPS